jgi:hypothetical protein
MAANRDIVVSPASFRDPSGFVFYEGGEVYRQINQRFRRDYEALITSGLYESLVSKGLLIPHEECQSKSDLLAEAFKIIKPRQVEFVSYPYEWSFGQLKDAAIASLEVQEIALNHGMSLRDCSAYNIQFVDGRPTLIDTLSFEVYKEAKPWVAYKQFCEHFLAPLSLMSFTDVRLGQLLLTQLDGIPLGLTRKILPWWSWLNMGTSIHVHLHSLTQERYANKSVAFSGHRRDFGIRSFRGLLSSLSHHVERMQLKLSEAGWKNYYSENLSDEYLERKKRVVSDLIDLAAPLSVWDLGSNIGVFSRLVSNKGIPTISFDKDPFCVEANYQQVKQLRETNILPLVVDITIPSPSIGWENKERLSIFGRGAPDLIMALALIHHLAISNNLPLDKLADFFGSVCRWLLIEFVAKSDPNVQKLLQYREDIFSEYSLEHFELEFKKRFNIMRRAELDSGHRYLYLMRRKDANI